MDKPCASLPGVTEWQTAALLAGVGVASAEAGMHKVVRFRLRSIFFSKAFFFVFDCAPFCFRRPSFLFSKAFVIVREGLRGDRGLTRAWTGRRFVRVGRRFVRVVRSLARAGGGGDSRWVQASWEGAVRLGSRYSEGITPKVFLKLEAKALWVL